MHKKAKITIGAYIAVSLIIIIIVGFIVFMQKKGEGDPGTGGSGVPSYGTVTLRNVIEPTNDTDRIPLADFLTTDQQNAIRSGLSKLFKKKHPNITQYDSTVQEGSVKVNYETNEITFTVETDDVKDLYLITIDTVKNYFIIKNLENTVLYYDSRNENNL